MITSILRVVPNIASNHPAGWEREDLYGPCFDLSRSGGSVYMSGREILAASTEVNVYEIGHRTSLHIWGRDFLFSDEE